MAILYHHPMSGPSRYVRLLLGEYSLAAELAEERPWLRREEYLAINAAGAVPAMVESGRDPVCGATIIGEYLDETAGALMRDRRLMPENPHGRAEVRRVSEWFLVKYEAEVSRYLVHERAIKQLMRGADGGGPPDPSMIRAGRANLKNHLRYAGWLAASRGWLAGPKLSQADLAAAAQFSVADYLGEIAWDSEPAAREWYARVKSRPSFRPLLADRLGGIAPSAHYANLDF
jgi:glutathione S-transferase